MIISESFAKARGVIAAGVTGLLVIGVLVGATLLGDKTSNTQDVLALSNHIDSTTGFSVDYNSNLELTANNPPKDTVLFNLAKTDPKIQVTSWYEEGDSIAKLNALDKPLNELMMQNVKKQIKNIYPDIDITDEKLVNINGFDGGEITFNYTSNGDIPTTQRLLVLIKDSDTAVTIAAQSLQDQFEQVNKEYFDKIISSAKFQ